MDTDAAGKQADAPPPAPKLRQEPLDRLSGWVNKFGPAWKPTLWAVLLIGGTVPLVLYAQSQPMPGAVLSGGALIAVGSAMVGSFLGLLFGAPLTGSPGQNANHADATMRDNTALEEVSDWLTKIIVGVGLTQLGSIPNDLQRLVDYARGALSGPPEPGPMVAALILTYSSAGFLLTYLYARTDLERQFREAHRGNS